MDPSAPVRAHRVARGDGRTPAPPRSTRVRLGVAIGTGIGGVWTLLDQWDILQGEGRRAGSSPSPSRCSCRTPRPAASRCSSAPAPARTPPCRPAPRAPSRWARLRHDPQPAAPTSWSPAAPRPPSTRCRSPGSPRCRRCRPATTTRRRVPALRHRPRRLRHGRGRRRRWCSRSTSTPRPAAPGSTPSSPAIGMSADAHHITAPEPEGAGASRARCARPSSAAGLTAKDIVHINAHATSTPVGDVAEANAIRRAFGDGRRRHVVSAPPSR